MKDMTITMLAEISIIITAIGIIWSFPLNAIGALVITIAAIQMIVIGWPDKHRSISEEE